MKKKLMALGLITAMVFAMSACGQKEEEADAGVPNPVHECSKDDMLNVTHIDIDAPEGAEDVVYSYIDGTEDSSEIAQVVFKLDGTEFCYRAQSTDVTSLDADIDPESMDPSALEDAVADVQEKTTALTGMYDEFKLGAAVQVADRDAVVALNKGKSGYIVWLDVVPGFMYSLSVDKGASQELLTDTAAKIFVPMQGEA